MSSIEADRVDRRETEAIGVVKCALMKDVEHCMT